MIVFWILIYGALRIVQANCNKQASSLLNSQRIFFQYGSYFEFAAAVFSFVYVCIVGFYGFNGITLLCAALTGIFFVTELLTSLEAMKGAPLVLCNMCAMGGGIVLLSIIAIFFFQEPMTIVQWLGVAVFFMAAYCLSPGTAAKGEKGTRKMTAKTWIMLILNFFINGACGVVGKYFAVRVENGNAALYSFLTYFSSTILYVLLLGILVWKQKKEVQTEEKSQWKFPRKLYFYGGFLGVICSTIVFLSTVLSRTIPVVILNTVPSAISIIGCLFVGALLFKEKITIKNSIGVVLGILSVVMIVA